MAQNVSHACCRRCDVARAVDASACQGRPRRDRYVARHCLIQGSIEQRIDMRRRKLHLVGADRRFKITGKRFELGRREVRDADGADLPRRNQAIQCRRQFRRMGQEIRAVDIKQVDPFDAQSGEAALASRSQVGAGGVIRSAPLDADFGGDDGAFQQLRSAGVHSAQQTFASSEAAMAAIDVGRIEMIDSVFARQRKHRDRSIGLVFAIAPQSIGEPPPSRLRQGKHRSS